MDFLAIIKTVLSWIFSGLAHRRKVRVLCHRAYLSPSTECYFVNVTNLSPSRDIEITHVWFDCQPRIDVLNPERPLPKRLRPDEPWETWIEVQRLPSSAGNNVYTMARVRLSNGRIIKSKFNRDVPNAGYVPGGVRGR